MSGVFDIVGDLVGTGVNAGVNIYGIQQGRKTAKENLALAKDAFQYQQWLNQKVMEREDTAYQRSVLDRMNAGLSPLDAQQAGAVSLSSGEAPQEDSSYLRGLSDLGSSIQSGARNLVNDYYQNAEKSANIDLLASQAERNRAEAERLNIANAYDGATLTDRIAMLSEQYNNLKTKNTYQAQLLREEINELLSRQNEMNASAESARTQSKIRSDSAVWYDSVGLPPDGSLNLGVMQNMGLWTGKNAHDLGEQKKIQEQALNQLTDDGYQNYQILHKDWQRQVDRVKQLSREGKISVEETNRQLSRLRELEPDLNDYVPHKK